MTARFPWGFGFAKQATGGPRWTGKVEVIESQLEQPFRWAEGRKIFVNSISDSFHESLSVQDLERFFRVMRLADWHIYLVLTKRAQRMEYLMKPRRGITGAPNVWHGVSVENRKHGLPRIDSLRRTPCDVRFLSIEPLLEDLGELDLSGISWVICGGESGNKARPMHPDWARNIRDQCFVQGVPFLFKQWGRYVPGVAGSGKHVSSGTGVPGAWMLPVGKEAAGNNLDGDQHLAFPDLPMPEARDKSYRSEALKAYSRSDPRNPPAQVELFA